jgi:hypothetical protein
MKKLQLTFWIVWILALLDIFLVWVTQGSVQASNLTGFDLFIKYIPELFKNFSYAIVIIEGYLVGLLMILFHHFIKSKPILVFGFILMYLCLVAFIVLLALAGLGGHTYIAIREGYWLAWIFTIALTILSVKLQKSVQGSSIS